MKDKDLASKYVSNFRRHFSHYLLPGVSLKSSVILVKDGGGIVKLSFSRKGSADDVLPTAKTMSEALTSFGIKSFGDAQGIVFSGTNMVLEGDSMFLIKGEDSSAWTDAGAKDDVKRILDAARKQKP
ncbi:hypothetical protein [Pseudomonas sp. PP3]|uniref:hypothetical protein n=1 Tax=Pseudomonas sp. PP3 TaxID=2815936 RepID=UPI001BAF5A68|nr:hypothetical protein [Pseudomonas sp. PP3]